nr:hypothetical protein GZ19A5_27 [uncultured archaeon GZfos19A5]
MFALENCVRLLKHLILDLEEEKFHNRMEKNSSRFSTRMPFAPHALNWLAYNMVYLAHVVHWRYYHAYTAFHEKFPKISEKENRRATSIKSDKRVKIGRK